MDIRLKNILTNVFNLKENEIHLNLSKENLGSWDSLRQMDLVMSIENEYKILLEIQDIIKMISVADILQVLSDKGVIFENQG